MKFLIKEIDALGIKASLRVYIPDVSRDAFYKENRPAVIIFPGGGYSFTFCGEAEPIALKFVAEGVCAFVLDYSCAPTRFPVPQLQAFKAIRYVRENAQDFGIDGNNISTLGFSAGGHLCSCTGTLWNKFSEYFNQSGMDDVEDIIYRPNKMILCYPVICSPINKCSHKESFENLLGDKISDLELLKLLSTDKQIDEKSSMTFIWHTSEDESVSPINSYNFALALVENKVTCETHVYLRGGHGLCLGNCVTSKYDFANPHETAEWINKAIAFAYIK